MSNTPDEAQADQPPAARKQTAMQAAEAAMSVAQGARAEADNAVGLFEGLSEKLTDLNQRFQDRHDALNSPAADAPTRDQMDARIGDALQPVKEELGGYVGAINRKLDDFRTRLGKLEGSLPAADLGPRVAAVEEALMSQGDPASDMLAEDAVNDMVESRIKGQMTSILARLEAAERKAADAAQMNLAGVNPQYVADLGDRVTTLEATRHATATTELFDTPPTGTGAQRKVLELMRAVDVIGKERQVNAPGQKFAYRGVDDAMDAVGRAMRTIGLIYAPEVLDKQISHDESENRDGRRLLWTSVYLTVRYTFTDPEDGSTHSFTMAGEGRASDDKGTSKAHAMALKYGLLHALMIPVSDMPDGDAEQPQVARPPASGPPSQRPQSDGPPRVPMTERARQAVEAAQSLTSAPMSVEDRRKRLNDIGHHASNEGLLDIPVEFKGETAKVSAWLHAVGQMLQAQ